MDTPAAHTEHTSHAAGRRVAFFGGSFDPPHQGHLAIAAAARDALSLDEVLFAPVGLQPLKPKGAGASFADRIAMTELAIAGQRGFTVSRADAPQPSGAPNYTFDTLTRLHADLPAESRLYCLIGADSLINLRSWHRAAEIPFLAPLIVANRPGEPLQGLAALFPDGITVIPDFDPPNPPPSSLLIYTLTSSTGANAPLYLLADLHYEISATTLRSALLQSASNDALIPTAVRTYIKQNRLYR